MKENFQGNPYLFEQWMDIENARTPFFQRLKKWVRFQFFRIEMKWKLKVPFKNSKRWYHPGCIHHVYRKIYGDRMIPIPAEIGSTTFETAGISTVIGISGDQKKQRRIYETVRYWRLPLQNEYCIQLKDDEMKPAGRYNPSVENFVERVVFGIKRQKRINALCESMRFPELFFKREQNGNWRQVRTAL